LSSVSRFVHALPLQCSSPLAQHTPSSHVPGAGQLWPQPPQCAALDFGSSHVPPQLILPASQQMPPTLTLPSAQHRPPSQVWFAPHTTPPPPLPAQPPQFASSLCGSMHAPLHSTVPGAQSSTH